MTKNKKQPYNLYVLHDLILKANLTIVTGDFEAFKKNCIFENLEKHLEGIEYSDARFIPLEENGKSANIIFLKKIDLATISHELIHHCFYTFNNRGIPIRYENDEIFAYYYEMLFEQVLRYKGLCINVNNVEKKI